MKISSKDYHIELTCKQICINYAKLCKQCCYGNKKVDKSKFKPRGVK